MFKHEFVREICAGPGLWDRAAGKAPRHQQRLLPVSVRRIVVFFSGLHQAMHCPSPAATRSCRSQSEFLQLLPPLNACVHEVQRKERHAGGCIGLEKMQLAMCANLRWTVFVGQGCRQGVATPTWVVVEFC